GQVETGGVGLQGVGSGLHCCKMKFSRGIAGGLLGDAAFRALQGYASAYYCVAGGIAKHAIQRSLGDGGVRENSREQKQRKRKSAHETVPRTFACRCRE